MSYITAFDLDPYLWGHLLMNLKKKREKKSCLWHNFPSTGGILFTPQPSRLKGYCHHGQGSHVGGLLGRRSGGRTGGCQPCGNYISVTAWQIFNRSSVELSRPVVVHCHGHLPICPIWACPWAKNWVQILRIAYLWNRWMDLPHLKFHGLRDLQLCDVIVICPIWACPRAKNWVQILQNVYLQNRWTDLPHLKFHGLRDLQLCYVIIICPFPHMGLPMGQKLVKSGITWVRLCGTQISELTRWIYTIWSSMGLPRPVVVQHHGHLTLTLDFQGQILTCISVMGRMIDMEQKGCKLIRC